jgi:hypothetical protein
MTKYLHQDSSVFQTMDITRLKKNEKITFKPPKLPIEKFEIFSVLSHLFFPLLSFLPVVARVGALR